MGSESFYTSEEMEQAIRDKWLTNDMWLGLW